MAALLPALLFQASEYFIAPKAPLVEISSGRIKGTVSYSREGREYFEFLGIPYARPPVGNLRFEPPFPPEPWRGVKMTNKFGSECLQLEVMVTARVQGDEDCLFLNVFTPKLDGRLPVMVFIHGGLFMAGSSNMYKGKYFMDEDIVLVTMNYRLAALGFLNTGDEMVRGNMGLKDQNMALRWVQKEIKNFGGDPTRVTIFGESAGGASVHYHMLSPLSKGLFHKAISQSGSAVKMWALNKNPEDQAQRLAIQMRCPITNNTRDFVHCLKRVDPRRLVQVHIPSMSILRQPYDIYVPTVEKILGPDAFLTEDPLVLLESGRFHKVPWALGCNSGEGLMSVGRKKEYLSRRDGTSNPTHLPLTHYFKGILANNTISRRLNAEWMNWAPIMLQYDPANVEVSRKVRNFYFGNNFINPSSNIENLTRLFSDRIYFHPTHKVALFHAQHAPTYLYYNSYPVEISLYSLFKAVTPGPGGYLPVELEVASDFLQDMFSKYVLKNPTKHPGPCHADELPLFFNMHFMADISQSSRDYTMSRSMVQLWSEFAKDENKMRFFRSHWEPIHPKETLRYLQIDKNGGMIDEPNWEGIKFWELLGV